jgi:glycosyltransferase involved in cell wall biosynthesis
LKIIALIPFKNEEWILPVCLSSLKNICDEVICIDDDSTDRSLEIAENFGCKVYKNDAFVKVGWSEHHIRENLLKLGRESGGTHFICLDADEALTKQFSKNARKIIEKLQPGQKLSMQWLALWKSKNHYRDDNSVWSNNYKDFIVCDKSDLKYDYQWLHVGRTPGVNNDNTLLKLNPKFGAVLHYQFCDWENFQIKQCYLRCSELIKNPGNEYNINKKYSITLDSDNVYLKEIPEDWSPEKNPDFSKREMDWRFFKIKDFFSEYGVEFFSKLEIWHCKSIQELVKNK